MRVSRWKAKEVLEEIYDTAVENATDIMTDIVSEAKRRCPVDPETFREGRFGSANITFTPKTGRNKGNLVSFSTDKRWMGREPGDLRRTIRLVSSREDKGNQRVYAGNFKIYWALYIERGYHDRAGKHHAAVPFLRAPFNVMKKNMLKRIKDGK